MVNPNGHKKMLDMKNLTYICIIGLFSLAMAACKEELIGPTTASQGIPGPVTNARVENLPGAARITYTLPGNTDLLYVKALYNVGSKQREAKASLFNNYLIVDGFGNTNPCEVKLYAVNRSEESSTPVSVTVQPLEPPVITIGKSIVTKGDFGGLSLTFNNDTESEVSIHVLTLDSLGDWVPVDVLYTKRKGGNFAVRGFEAKPRKFAVFVKDRWDNRSDTIETEVTPLFEAELARANFKELRLASDAPLTDPGWNFTLLFDNQFADICYHTAVGSGMPQWFTIDMTKVATISRMKMWQRQGNIYDHANVKKFEIWGSNNPTDAWASWTRIETFESYKPSGAPKGAVTSEDIAFAAAGEEFVFPSGVPPYRYLRFKTLENWSGSNFVHILELRFWGIQ
jgi:hypothetical protein